MLIITANQLVAHAVGDYMLQSDWMASEKTSRTWPALCHAFFYTLPFLFLTQSPAALGVIACSHFVIDRWRLARYVVWVKNFLAPRWRSVVEEKDFEGKDVVTRWPWNPTFWACNATGSPPERPLWLVVWLLIIVDNTIHVVCNALAIYYLGSP